MTMDTPICTEDFEDRLNLLVGKPAWAVQHSVGTTVLIDFGEKLPLKRMYGKRVPYEGDKRYEGELTLMISCAWRVEVEGEGIVSGSGDLEDETMVSGLKRLVGETVADISLNSDLDLLVVFSANVRLRLFCDVRGDDCYTLFVRPEEAYTVIDGVVVIERSSGEAH